ncbi:protein HESO1 isoform X3 [Castanea sativa]|uniref:protein HESO1 isoform X3 n=1 Tax=Castanea sativa TaxID=21020 RepID=UPI003F651F77
MSAYITLELEHTLKEILQVVKPQQGDRSTRLQVINELQGVVESVESLRGGWRRIKYIPNARVPILKFESSRQSISCDVSIDNLQGQMKSKLLFRISEIDERFHDMVLLVKEWAKAHDINNPKSGTFNSYSLSLLVIFHFQTCEPAILPPLRDIYTGNVADDLQGVRANVERHIAETCAANIVRFRQTRSRKVNRSSLSELFRSFLAKFSNIGLRASEQGICPYTGKWEFIRSNMRWLPKTYAIFIEDPFEQPENSARTVSMGNLTRISEAFERSHHRLSSADQNQGSLLATLVPPQVSQYIARATPLPSPTYNGRRYHPQPTRPQMYRNMHTPSQTQHQFQNMRLETPQTQHQFQNTRLETPQTQHQFQNMTRPVQANHYSTMTRPVQANHNQGQQRWRARSDR